MVFRVVEGRVVQLGSVSGTDETPIALYAPTNAQRIFIENPFLAPNFEQTVINTTASGSAVQIVGGGIVNVATQGNTVTVSGPAFEELEGDDVDSINTVTGTVTLNGSDGNIANTIGQTITIQGFRSEFLAASGSLSAEIDSDISTHASDADAHHIKYTDAEAVAALGTITSELAVSGSNNANEIVTVSGFLQSEIDANTSAIVALDVVDSLNSLTGNLTITAGSNITLDDNGLDIITINSFTDDDVDSINTVTGTVTIQGQNTVSVSTLDPIITISGSGISSLGPGPDGLVFIDDPTRSNKRLSVDRQVVLYSEDGSIDNTYLRAGNVVNNFAGWIIPRNATITAATYGYISGNTTKNFILRINNSTDLKTSNVPRATPFLDTGLNIDVSAGDVLQIFIDGAGAAINDAFATIELAWRV